MAIISVPLFLIEPEFKETELAAIYNTSLALVAALLAPIASENTKSLVHDPLAKLRRWGPRPDPEP